LERLPRRGFDNRSRKELNHGFRGFHGQGKGLIMQRHSAEKPHPKMILPQESAKIAKKKRRKLLSMWILRSFSAIISFVFYILIYLD
jgi:hypothetical protein